jgi:histidinol phosphatase-like enzyme
MKESVVSAGGKIDDIFYCTAVDNDHPDRKPNPGMGLKAKEKYPEIGLSKSIVIGDKASDMKLGRNLSAKTVLIASDRYKDSIDEKDVDLYCKGLLEFVQILKSVNP